MIWLLLLLSCAPTSSTVGEALLQAGSTEARAEEPAVQPTLLANSDPWTLREGATRAGVAWPPPGLALQVVKSTRTLSALSGGTTLKRYRVGLGDPDGAKQRQGDRRTPEGKLRIVTRNTRSNFHRFLGISYPTAADADRGLRAGLITRSQADAIRAAEAAGRAPPWDTPLGGTVGIHGGGGEVDWTLGCIAVTDAEIDELFEVVHVGTPLSVLP